MKPQVGALAAALAQIRALLRKHGEKFASARVEYLETRLARGDWTAVESAVSEATGGMGSLRDRGLSKANGDSISYEDEAPVNARLEELVKEIERSARAAAAALGIPLIR
jgi:hypothetical protein